MQKQTKSQSLWRFLWYVLSVQLVNIAVKSRLWAPIRIKLMGMYNIGCIEKLKPKLLRFFFIKSLFSSGFVYFLVSQNVSKNTSIMFEIHNAYRLNIYSPKVLVIPRKRWLPPNMTEQLFTGTLRINQPTRLKRKIKTFEIASMYIWLFQKYNVRKVQSSLPNV